jgi:hypothetical protein
MICYLKNKVILIKKRVVTRHIHIFFDVEEIPFNGERDSTLFTYRKNELTMIIEFKFF